MPDTICINNDLQITNTSTGATNYFWNFCVADLITTPLAQNIGNPGNTLSWPVFMDYTEVNGNYYGFVTNYLPGGLVRLDFGNSLLNNPTATYLGNFGGLLPARSSTEGIQLVFNEGRWYAIIVAGNINEGSTPRVMKIDFGADITNNTPVATSWGDIGNMAQPLDLHVFKEGNNWYGLTVNGENNTITRFDFTNSFNNTPIAQNLGNIGGLSYPTGIFAITDNGSWKVFITNGGDNTRVGNNSSITRLDFGSSLLNIPTGVNLGNPGGALRHPRDLTITRSCGQIVGFAVNGELGRPQLLNINFNNDLNAGPVIQQLGNVGNFAFPVSISKVFRVRDNLYAFVCNVENNTISRLQFAGCTNASQASSTDQTPPAIRYNTPGTYNINLTIDEGLGSQQAICKPVTVVAPPVKRPTRTLSLCVGGNLLLSTPTPNAINTWNTGATTESITVTTPGVYWVDKERFGCLTRDSFVVQSHAADFSFEQDLCSPFRVRLTDLTTDVVSRTWDFGNGSTGNAGVANAVYPGNGTYTVTLNVRTQNGCALQVIKPVPVQQIIANVIGNGDTVVCAGADVTLLATGAGVGSCWFPAVGLTSVNPDRLNLTMGNTTRIYYRHTRLPGVGILRDSVIIRVDIPAVSAGNDVMVCTGASTMLQASGAQTYAWQPDADLSAVDIANPSASPTVGKEYVVTGTSVYGCTANDTVLINLYPVAAITLQGDTAICPGTRVVLPVSGGASYSWSPANTLDDASGNRPIAGPTEQTRYDVLITDANNCQYQEHVTVSFRTRPAFAISDAQQVCAGDAVTLEASGGDQYNWMPAASLSDASSGMTEASPEANTTYFVSARESVCGFDTTMQVEVQVNPIPEIHATKSNDIDCAAHTAQLSATGALAFTWQPITGLDQPHSRQTRVSIDTTTTYTVWGSNSYGCSSTDVVTVYVVSAGKVTFVVPNAFSPNHDGRNDCFSVRQWGGVQLKNLSVYDRWGKRVFYTTNPNFCWDGTVNGVPQEVGTYVYFIEASTICGDIKRNGSLTLVR
ncbi:gliding motility-associated C-terminal domain-containing protein [Chitinophaga horti]|uniref:Gliding motility-associated C-terminal domain-containing protein n=1 Tax=Chitinophaga horti TaxID=2920382 RepID=A0ABY6J4M2_9BACT|nr:gliding motility-associated C-terminal domain-containing protein [Chitinophaga horti]UYQ94450.1 gliding motility-associated C-terminal domain-containing protein [Chitinophaga horti]